MKAYLFYFMEIWKDIKGYSNYKVSNAGRVKNILRDKILKGCKDKDGYIISVLKDDNGNKKTKKFHRLVAQSFIPNPDNKPQVNHIDGNKLNNNDWNLEWNTAKENNLHAYDTGLKKGIPSEYLSSRIGALNVKSKRVINTKTKKVFNSIKEASDFYSIRYNILSKNLNGQNVNKTDLAYYI